MRAAFITIGQSPRIDLVPEMRQWIGPGLKILERGALDGLGRAEIAALAPRRGDHHLVTKLADGSAVTVGKRLIRRRVQRVLDDLAGERLDLAVLLCTGRLPRLKAPCLFLEAQWIMDHAIAAIAAGARSIGVMLPVAVQVKEFRVPWRRGPRARVSHASPYEPSRLVRAARELAQTDVIAMHCIGYTERQRRAVADLTGRPVLLARRLVAAAVDQLL